ncbi:monovalent cation/H+ antiporter complex subunit F [Corynebacterium poyangense]|uniref:monovalent cation/H+ antiporter complex subunit F n=1 Tax=Corynebacterium poyangense TaxID=2684405 RepID=UPI00165D1D60|nr:monovalent cation/H+ antiporter complex subunit F [Corynebacterium poyangense]
MFNAVLLVSGILFALSFLLTMWRILIGPNSLDRLLGLDGLIAMIQCMFATLICWTLDTTIANAMMVVALLGFISSVSVARFRKRDGS